jgi:two-component system sensor histidine kinase TctE
LKLAAKLDLSLRAQLLRWLLLPLCIIWLVNSALSYPIALQLANEAFDRDLLNSADSVVARIKINPGGATVDLPPAAQAILRYHNDDKLYYQVVTDSGRNIAGDKIPIPSTPISETAPSFRYGIIDGQDVRIAALYVQNPSDSMQPLLVQVAETLTSRKQLGEHMWSTIVIPQLLLIVIGALAISFGIGRGLSPLAKLGNAISSRSQFDLSPVSERDAPQEVRPIVTAINDLLGRLREDLDAQRRFVANAAHQLRTPVAGTKTFVGLARRQSRDSEINELLSQIDSGLNRMTRLINQLLSLARAEPRSVGAFAEIVDINLIGAEVCATLIAEAVAKDIKLTFDGAVDSTLVTGNRRMLYELVSNLVDNAVRYTPNGGHVQVKVTNDFQTTISVQDNGPGIAEDQRELVFERFYRIDDSETSVEGSGLGLSIVREIACAHNANVSIDTPGGGGTVVKVCFPKTNSNLGANIRHQV